jgi:hypothetical protein
VEGGRWKVEGQLLAALKMLVPLTTNGVLGREPVTDLNGTPSSSYWATSGGWEMRISGDTHKQYFVQAVQWHALHGHGLPASVLKRN